MIAYARTSASIRRCVEGGFSPRASRACRFADAVRRTKALCCAHLRVRSSADSRRAPAPTFRSSSKDIHLINHAVARNNSQVVDAYLKPEVDRDERPLEWARPDLQGLRDFAASKFGWGSRRGHRTLGSEAYAPPTRGLASALNPTGLQYGHLSNW